MEFWRSLIGTVQVELTSADLSASLAVMQKHGIEIRQIERIDALQLTFQIDRHDYTKLRQLGHGEGKIGLVVQEEDRDEHKKGNKIPR